MGFNKTASLMANSCKAVAILANHGSKAEGIEDVAFTYGQNIGIAFQLVDDLLDFVQSAELLGKPAGADLSLGLATAPVLFASSEFPQLHSLILRQFQEQGDVEAAFQLVCQSQGLNRTKELARSYSQKARDSLQCLKDSEEKQGLIDLAGTLMERCK